LGTPRHVTPDKMILGICLKMLFNISKKNINMELEKIIDVHENKKN